MWPPATTSARSSAWFSMIPLWIRASRPVQSVWGWAFSSVGWPWVAQRVCPMAAAWPFGAPAVRSVNVASDVLPVAARARQTAAVDHHGDARRVVPAVLQLVQPVAEQRDGVGLAGDADDAAHGGSRLPALTWEPAAGAGALPGAPPARGRARPRRPDATRPRWPAPPSRASTITRTTGSVPLGPEQYPAVMAELGLRLDHRLPDLGAVGQALGLGDAAR